MKKQPAEILTAYGPIDLLWIDQHANNNTGARWPELRVPVAADAATGGQPAEAVVARLRLCNARNATYLLDVPPDRDGLISGAHLQRLREIGTLLRAARPVGPGDPPAR